MVSQERTVSPEQMVSLERKVMAENVEHLVEMVHLEELEKKEIPELSLVPLDHLDHQESPYPEHPEPRLVHFSKTVYLESG